MAVYWDTGIGAIIAGAVFIITTLLLLDMSLIIWQKQMPQGTLVPDKGDKNYNFDHKKIMPLISGNPALKATP